MSAAKIVLSAMLTLSRIALATSPSESEKKLPAQAFFTTNEIPPIGNFALEQLQLLHMIYTMQMTAQKKIAPVEVYAIRPNSPRMWGGAY